MCTVGKNSVKKVNTTSASNCSANESTSTATSDGVVRRLLRFISFFIYFGAWIGGAVLLFAAIILEPLLFQTATLLVVLATYYTYRFIIVPHAPWKWLHTLNTRWNSTFPYFRSQRTIFTSKSHPKPDDKSLLCFHPHGIMCCGFTMSGASKEFLNTDCHWLVADILLYVPMIADLLSYFRAGAASKKNMLSIMKSGGNICFYPGGYEEATHFETGVHKVYIKNRKGFIKYALQHGYSVHPVYVFGEEQTFNTLNAFLSIRLWLNQFKIPAVIFCGYWWCFFLPNANIDLATVVGTPLSFPTIDNPTATDVDKYHSQYVDALVTLFDQHKATYAAEGKNATLVVI